MWVQDEPTNQGAWPFLALNLPEAPRAEGEPGRCGRLAGPSASPATGSTKKHQAEQADRRSHGPSTADRWRRSVRVAHADG